MRTSLIIDNLKKLWPAMLALFLLLSLWEAAVAVFAIPGYLLPAPSKVFLSLITEFPFFAPHLLITLGETVLGILLAVALGVIIALLMHVWPFLDKALSPLLVVSQTVPIVAVAPLLIIYLGFGLAPKIFTVVLMCFFPITISLKNAMTQMDANYKLLLKSMGAKRRHIILEAELPFAAAGFISGLKVSMTYAVTGAIVGEWLGSDGGLGYLLIRAKNAYMLDRVFAIIVLIILLSLMLFALCSALQRLLLPYQFNSRRRWP